jgi:hypothetical protein
MPEIKHCSPGLQACPWSRDDEALSAGWLRPDGTRVEHSHVAMLALGAIAVAAFRAAIATRAPVQACTRAGLATSSHAIGGLAGLRTV